MAVDLTGEIIGRLLVIEEIKGYKDKSNVYWKCKCDCGNTTYVLSSNLIGGTTKSCGCLKNEMARERFKTHGDSRPGADLFRLYSIWCGIKQRCNNTHNHAYKYYGGSGISVCKEWEDDYVSFREWSLANGYSDDMTIDRIDCNGDYSPENCRWVDMSVQNNNKDNIRRYEYNGESHTITEWSDITGISFTTLYGRIVHRNWSIERALTAPVRTQHYNNVNDIEYNGVTHSLREWSNILGINYSTLHWRLFEKGDSVEEALTAPIRHSNAYDMARDREDKV